ncbi:hypothetical protein AM587_10010956 [Phytophthora nicotianae]|uniref:Protein kinase domain-containing protein n=1 Tax=Phytophthora nicotianae TaxID=4792 RepID=A0A0W8BWS8_PHYNI|nr:hypothetical protein AM587_10010956 [Phytophthora nicotianae]
MRLWWVWVATCALPLGLHAATTCPESGIAPPSEVTLAAAADGANDVAILVKNSDCDEVTIEATESEDPGSYRINASYVDIEVVESYPEVASLWLWNNKIKTFKAVGTSVTEVTLDLNALTSTSASNFPDGLQRLYLRKNSITSLAKFRFSSELQNLYLNGNQQLTTLKGAVFPDSLQLIECSDCRITEIVGVTFPSKLKTMTLGGTTVTNFVVRESDVDVLKTAQLSLTVSLDEDDCSSVSGTVTTISSSVSACVLDDTSFSSLYPISNDSGSSGTSSSNSTTTSSSSTNGDSTTSSNNTNQASGGSGTNTVVINETSSSSSAGLIGGIVAGVVAVLLIIVGFIVYRRRQNKRRNSNADGFMALPTSKNPSGGLTAGSASQTLSLPPSSDGYLSNDVRNDEDLIPYRLPIEDIVIQEELASGGFGVVHLAHLYGQRVVVKQILPKAMSKDLLRRFMDEIRLYARMDHPKIVHFIGLAWTNLLDLSLVVEYMPRGDLTTLIRQKRLEKDGRRTFSWVGEDSQPRSKIEIALDMAEGLVYLHSFDPTIIHRDIKSRNVLLNHEWEAKLSDFGISREASESTMTGGMGTIAWIAPEVLQGERYSESADIFSLGITLSEMDTCGHPYNSHKSEVDALTDAKIALLVSTNAIKPTIEDDCPPEIRDVILKCVSFNASDRPTAVALHYQLRTIANTYQDMAMMQ